MSYEPDSQGRPSREGTSSNDQTNRSGNDDQRRYRDEIYSRRIPAGKRTYFFDVKSTRSGEDFFITVTESKRIDEGRYEKHKLFLYKEDFGKFVRALHEVMNHIRVECLPDYEFSGLPDLTLPEDEEKTYGDDY